MSDLNPSDVREAIYDAIESLKRTRGFLPANVGFPLMNAHGKLELALVAIDAWEARLRCEQLEEKSNECD